MNHMQHLKLALQDSSVERYIRLGKHVKEQMVKRGYYVQDVRAIITDETSAIVEQGIGFNHKVREDCPTITVLGRDADKNPFVVIFSQEGDGQYSVVTAMPPLDSNRFNSII